MKATLEFVEERFSRFNALCFDGKLPPIPLRISNARTYLGLSRYRKRRGADGSVELYAFSISISGRFDLPESEIEDTVIHEMIHCYIWISGSKDTSAHGRLFRDMMERINREHGRHITISHRSTPQEREQAVDSRPRPHVVALVSFKDGRTGVKVLPCTDRSLVRYRRGVMLSGKVTDIEFYHTDNPWFNRFPCSSALNVIYKKREEILPHLESASPLNVGYFSVKR